MPYRIDLTHPPADAVDTLIDLGALDVEPSGDGLAAILPDSVPAGEVSRALGGVALRVAPAVGRDDQSVWTLRPRTTQVGSLVIVPASLPAPVGALRLGDAPAFGTGLHPTTVLCLEAIEELIAADAPDRMLDVGTGSGILALAALRRGVRRVVALDIDRQALRAAADNARLNDRAGHVALVCGTVESIRGSWPLVVANIRAAELMAMASQVVRRIGSRGRLVMSGIPESVAPDVIDAYRRRGMTLMRQTDRGGWSAVILQASW